MLRTPTVQWAGGGGYTDYLKHTFCYRLQLLWLRSESCKAREQESEPKPPHRRPLPGSEALVHIPNQAF